MSSTYKRYIKISSVVLSLLFLHSCGKLPDYQVNVASFGFSVAGQINSKVDILFVVDNSGSMSGNQTILSDSMTDFINTFSAKNLEFHIGVISTDQYCNTSVHSGSSCGTYWSSGGYTSYYNDKYSSLLSLYNGERYLTWQSTNFISKFQNNVLLGVSGDGGEMPILSATNALIDPKLTGWNNGFVRNNSYLSVIMVTDEDESTAVNNQTKIYNSSNLTGINSRVDGFLAAVEALKGESLPMFSLDVIARPPAAGTCSGTAERAYGLDYMVNRVNTLYPAVGGESAKARFTSICSNFSSELESIGNSIVQANARFELVQLPVDLNQIYVSNNGFLVNRSTTDGWEYYADGNYVQFFGASVPNVGDNIVVEYTPANPI